VASALGRFGDYVQLLRPYQWVKNVFVFIALVFGEKLTDPSAIVASLTAVAAFCLLSSAVYAFNDIRDRNEDMLHPTKRFRPLARGAITVGEAGVLCIGLLLGGIFLAWRLNLGFLTTAATYMALNLIYTLGGKRVPLVDVIIVAIAFVLRALGGSQAINLPVSVWLVLCTFTLCLFLGFGKRRCEIAMIHEAGGDAVRHRATLVHYTPDLLNHLLSTTAVLSVITFLLYTLDPHTLGGKFRAMFFTIPFVLYAIFRYAMVIERGRSTGPTDILIKDKPFLITCLLWGALTLAIVLRGERIEELLPKMRWPGDPSSEVSRPG